MEVIERKIVFAFNALSLMFVKELKKQHDQLRVVIKKNYRAYDKASYEYIEQFWDALKEIEDIDKIMVPESQVSDTSVVVSNQEENAKNLDEVCHAFKDSRLQNAEILKNLTVKKILELVSVENHPMVLSYLYGMYLFTYLKKELTEDNVAEIETLLTKSIASMDDDADLEECLNDVLDDDVKYLIRRMRVAKTFTIPEEVSKDTLGGNPDDYMNMFEGTKIGELAKDISEKIDLGDLANMQGNLNNLFSSTDGNNLIGNIIQQVGQTITSKLQSGELSQQDLMNEAMGMMGSAFGNPMMANMMKNMMGGGMGGRKHRRR